MNGGLDVNPTEAVWTLVTVFALAVTWGNLLDALGSWRAVRHTGRVREIQAWANVRGDGIRLVINASLFVLIIPAWFRPGDTPLSLGLVVIMLVPVGMALNSYLDRRTRQAITSMVSG